LTALADVSIFSILVLLAELNVADCANCTRKPEVPDILQLVIRKMSLSSTSSPFVLYAPTSSDLSRRISSYALSAATLGTIGIGRHSPGNDADGAHIHSAEFLLPHSTRLQPSRALSASRTRETKPGGA